MPDWTTYVKSRLGTTGLPGEREREIVEELAAHLHDAEQDGICQPPLNWPAFARQIRLAQKETTMKSRLQTLWIPGLISGLLATVSLAVIQKTGLRPMVTVGELVLYYPWFLWLLLLPPVGAIAAYMSRRAGGSVRMRVLASLFPCIGLLAPFLISSILSMIALLSAGDLALLTMPVWQFMVFWVALPAFLLAFGALPFLGTQNIIDPEQSHQARA